MAEHPSTLPRGEAPRGGKPLVTCPVCGKPTTALDSAMRQGSDSREFRHEGQDRKKHQAFEHARLTAPAVAAKLLKPRSPVFKAVERVGNLQDRRNIPKP